MNYNSNIPAAEMVPLPRAPQVFGLSRSAFYRLAADGKIRMVKMGSRTLGDAGSVRSVLATLPAMQPRPDAGRKAGGQ
jgi:predicted DNA-binding transcriptional regulator AlpA